MTVVVWLLALGATMRLTRLVTQDTFPPAALLRSKVGSRFGYDHAAYDLVTCVWCASWWLAAPVLAAAVLLGDSWWFLLPASALTFSLLSGMVLSQFTEAGD